MRTPSIKRGLVMLLTLLPLLTFAQLLEPIKWQTSLRDGQQKAEKEIVFKATIDPGWHLYAMNLPEGGPVSTSFSFETIKGGSLVGGIEATSKAITKFDALFDMTLSWYATEGVFIQKVKVTDPSSFRAEGTIRYMACNDEQCLAPTNEPFEVVLKAETAAGSNKTTPSTVAANTVSLAGSTTAKGTTTLEGSSTPMGVTTMDGTTPPEGSTILDGTTPPDGSVTINGPTTTDAMDAVDASMTVLWQPVVDELKDLGDKHSNSGDSSWWILFITGFLGGFIALLTPCVWPIIPMTVSFFLKRNKNRRKAIREAMLYGLSIIVIYLALGLGITAIFGASALNSLSTSALFNVLFFVLLVVFAISFFGAFELVLPSSWTTKIDQKADNTSGLISIFFMAFTLVLVSFSCTGPIIGTLLVQAASMNALGGPAIGMFGFALALAIPFALFAIFPNWLQGMPKSGGWLNTVKVVLGFLELAFALKFLSVADLAYGWGILDRETFLALWIVIFLLLGLYLLNMIRLPHDDKQEHVSVPKLFMALISLAFAIYMIPGLWGAPLKAISAFAPPSYTQDFNLYNNEVHAHFDHYEAGMAAAKQQNKPVLIDFSGYGCVNCRKMENSVWQDPKVKRLIEEEYVLITLMVDDKTPLNQPYVVEEHGKRRTIKTVGDHWSYLQRFKFESNSQPYYVLLDHEGSPLAPSYAYNEDVPAYVAFLESGLKAMKR